MALARTSLLSILLLASCVLCTARTTGKWRLSQQRTSTLPDFRYNTARVDGITRLFNDSMVLISNGYYWMLGKGEQPRARNVKGPITDLYPDFKEIDAIWTDPYNDIGQQIFLASNTPAHGLRVVCQEFGEPFTNDSRFCHLPVDKKWKNALKDLQPDKPIDAVTWRNRTRDKDGGFWVFFQGSNMITIDPYEMRLRFTYDLKKWMNITQRITAAMYDYRQHRYNLFFDDDHDQYRTWTVNVSLMNRLPMSWDRAFLHGTLSPPMKINRDFFGFSEREIRNRAQPYYERIRPIKEIDDNRLGDKDKPERARNPTRTSTASTISDVLYVKPAKVEIGHNPVRNGKLQDQSEEDINWVEHDNGDAISYQKQLMRFGEEGVLDFAQDEAINAATHHWPSLLWLRMSFSLVCAILLQRLIMC